jgi:DNA-binding CsgD family transcriptional regulator
MTQEQMINMATGYIGISQAELARRIGDSPNNFNQKLRRGSVNMQAVAKALGCEYVSKFIFPDGTEI